MPEKGTSELPSIPVFLFASQVPCGEWLYSTCPVYHNVLSTGSKAMGQRDHGLNALKVLAKNKSFLFLKFIISDIFSWWYLTGTWLHDPSFLVPAINKSFGLGRQRLAQAIQKHNILCLLSKCWDPGMNHNIWLPLGFWVCLFVCFRLFGTVSCSVALAVLELDM